MPSQLVFGLDEAHRAVGAAHRLELRGELLLQQLARVAQALQPQPGILCGEQRNDSLAQDLLDRGDQVEPADAGQVRFDELERVLPDRAAVVHQRVEAAEHRVPRAHGRGPALAQPGIFFRLEPQDRPDGRIGGVEIGQAHHGVVQDPDDAVDVVDFLGKQRDRAGKDADGPDDALHEIVQVPGRGSLAHAPERFRQVRRRRAVQRLAYAGGQPSASETEHLGGRGLRRRGGDDLGLGTAHGGPPTAWARIFRNVARGNRAARGGGRTTAKERSVGPAPHAARLPPTPCLKVLRT